MAPSQSTQSRLHRPAEPRPSRGYGAFQRVGPEEAGWSNIGFSAHRLVRGQVVARPADGNEVAVLVVADAPGGNGSSYPPHRHDTEDRSLDEAVAPDDRDVALLPHGYLPVGQPAGYDGYHLNVMAGPTRSWHLALDRDHA